MAAFSQFSLGNNEHECRYALIQAGVEIFVASILAQALGPILVHAKDSVAPNKCFTVAYVAHTDHRIRFGYYTDVTLHHKLLKESEVLTYNDLLKVEFDDNRLIANPAIYSINGEYVMAGYELSLDELTEIQTNRLMAYLNLTWFTTIAKSEVNKYSILSDNPLSE